MERWWWLWLVELLLPLLLLLLLEEGVAVRTFFVDVVVSRMYGRDYISQPDFPTPNHNTTPPSIHPSIHPSNLIHTHLCAIFWRSALWLLPDADRAPMLTLVASAGRGGGMSALPPPPVVLPLLVREKR